MIFVFNLLNFRYFTKKLSGEKRRKKPNCSVAWHKNRSLQGERVGKKRRIAAQVHDSFNSKMQYQMKYFNSAFNTL